MKTTMKIVILLLMALLCNVSLSATELSADKMIKKITSMPPYMVHEDTEESFRNALENGKFWVDQQISTSYLFIKGDGIFGERLFILHDKDLYIIELSSLEREDGKEVFSIRVYNEKKKELNYIGELKKSLFER